MILSTSPCQGVAAPTAASCRLPHQICCGRRRFNTDRAKPRRGRRCEHAELVALRVGEHIPADLVIMGSLQWAPAARNSSVTPQRSQWMRFFTVLGSGTAWNTSSQGMPGAPSIQENPRSWSCIAATPNRSAHHRLIALMILSVDDHLVQPVRGQLGRLPDERAQLTAFGIGQHGPVRRLGQHPRAKIEEVLDRRNVQIEMDTLLDGDRLRNRIDPDGLLRNRADQLCPAGVGISGSVPAPATRTPPRAPRRRHRCTDP